MTIKTKRHPLKFYAIVAFGTLFFLGLGTLFLLMSIDILKKEDILTKEYFVPVLSLISYLIAFTLLYSYWKNAPQIFLDKNLIKIGKESFYLKNIKEIALTGKMPFKFLFIFPMEGTAILFSDGTEIFLFDDMYSNSYEIKFFLEQVVVKKQDFIPNSIKETNKDMALLETADTFRGNQWTSLRGISLWGLMGFFTFLLIAKFQNIQIGFLIFYIFFGVFWFSLHYWLMHFFSISNNHLVVRNHIFTWKKIIYRLNDIREVTFETQGNQPNCLRIITNDFRNKLYPAGTLRDKTWLEMKEQLESKGVTVRNECIYEDK